MRLLHAVEDVMGGGGANVTMMSQVLLGAVKPTAPPVQLAAFTV